MRRSPTKPSLAVLLLPAIFGLLSLLSTAGPAAAGKIEERIAALPAEHRRWLEDVELLISPAELEEFLELTKDYQRQAFIAAFWRARDPYPETERNELEEAWRARLAYVREHFPRTADERRRILLLNGEPHLRRSFDCRSDLTIPLEVWAYDGSDQVAFDVWLLFYQPRGTEAYRLWRPRDGHVALFGESAQTVISRCGARRQRLDTFSGDRDAASDRGPFVDVPFECAVRLLTTYCDGGRRDSPLLPALDFARLQERLTTFDQLERQLVERPAPEEGEWLASFQAVSTDLPAGAPTFAADLEVAFRGRRQSRTVTELRLSVPAAELGTVELPSGTSYDLLLLGEVLRDGELFDTFRYELHLPADGAAERLPVVVERSLRPGTYRLVVKLEDLHSGKLHRSERELVVPAVEEAWTPPANVDPAAEALLAAAGEVLAGRDPDLRLVPPPEWQPQTGMVRFDTVGGGEEIEAVTFFLNDRPVLTKKRPPYSVELDLGPVPRLHEVRVVAVGEDGEPLSSDEIEVNLGERRFRVRLVEPDEIRRYRGQVRARAEVRVPEGAGLEKLELFRGETLLATLYQEPFVHRVPLPDDGPTYLRAVGHLSDGSTAEDLAWVNAPGFMEEVDVDLVEVYAAVTDTQGRPLDGLGRDDFTVTEQGERQEIVRFETVEDRPLHVTVLLDTSASMEERLPATRQAAVSFLETILTQRDRISLITFNDRPHVRTGFTADLGELSVELAALKAERGTALFDSLITALYGMNGLGGQRAILLLTDGKDESSRHTFDDALSYARVAGVTVYTIGLGLPRTDLEVRRQLTKLARETGGGSFFVGDPTELPAVYERIERELRSRYLLVYQSSHDTSDRDFRPIAVTVGRPGATVQAISGYYP